MISNEILSVEKWSIRPLTIEQKKVQYLWQMLQRHKTLFSDLTRNDPENFARALSSPYVLWFEVWEKDMIVGLIWLTDIELVVDASIHMAFFDRRPLEKIGVCKAMLKWAFANLPLQRLTVTPPKIYVHTIRLLERLGFRMEGCKRQALLMGGKWIDQYVYGILRQEVEAQ